MPSITFQTTKPPPTPLTPYIFKSLLTWLAILKLDVGIKLA